MSERRELVRVRWLDAHGYSSWRALDVDLRSDFEVDTVGWVVAEEDDWIAVAQSVSSTGGMDHVYQIPKVSVLWMETIEAAPLAQESK